MIPLNLSDVFSDFWNDVQESLESLGPRAATDDSGRSLQLSCNLLGIQRANERFDEASWIQRIFKLGWLGWTGRKRDFVDVNISYTNYTSHMSIIPLWISPLELPGSTQLPTIFLGKTFATVSLCRISCLPPLHGLLILEKLSVLDFRVFCVFQVWILRPRYLNSKNI